jgi:hypothetical protein
VLLNATRVIGWILAVVATYGLLDVFTVEPGDARSDSGMWWTLGWLAVAGLIATLRFFPSARELDRQGVESVDDRALLFGGTMLADLIVVVAALLTGGYIAVLVTGAAEVDPSLWAAPLLLAFLGFVAWFTGVLVGYLVALPLQLLAYSLGRATSGGHVRPSVWTFAVLLLGITIGIGVGVFSVSWEGWIARFLVLIVILTGIEIPGVIEIVNQPFAWAARIVLIVTFLLGWLGTRAQRTERPLLRPGQRDPAERTEAELDKVRRRGRGALSARRRYGDDD